MLPFDKMLKHPGILNALLANPKRKFTIRELSVAAHAPYSTTWRIVEDLRSLGAISSERVGPSQHLSLNGDSPVVADLAGLHALDLAPHRAAAREFAKLVAELPEVRKAILFGSVAEGREGATSDIDVAIVLTRRNEAAMNRIYEIVGQVQDRTRLKVVPLAITPSELESQKQVAQAIRAGKVLFERS